MGTYAYASQEFDVPKSIWSREEKKLLRRLKPNCSLRELVKIFDLLGYDRSYDSIKHKGERLGIRFEGLTEPNTLDFPDDVIDCVNEIVSQRRIVIPSVQHNPAYRTPIRKPEKETAKDLIFEMAELRAELLLNQVTCVAEPPTDGIAIVALLSDVHMGRKLQDELGNQVYNVKIAKERIKNYAKTIVDTLTYNKNANELVLLLVGDLTDGLDIFPNQHESAEVSPLYQVSEMVRAIWDMVLYIRSFFPDLLIRISCAPGNHGRVYMSRVTNWDNVVYQQLALVADLCKMHGTESIDVSTNFNFSHNSIMIKGWKFMIRHWAPVQAETPAAKSKFSGWYAIHQWDAFCYAHWHHYGIYTWMGKPIIRNGSVIGADYHAEELALHDNANQMILGVTRNNLPLFSESAFLDR